MVDKWAGSIEIGVTTHNPAYLQLPSTMTNLRSGEAAEEPEDSGELQVNWGVSSTGTWMMTGNGVMHNGTTILDEYGHNLDRLKVREAPLRRPLGSTPESSAACPCRLVIRWAWCGRKTAASTSL